MNNSEVFLDCYNRIDNYLKNNGSQDSTVTFTQKLKTSKNPVVTRNIAELISLGELRNAIVHTTKINGTEAIAEPHIKTVLRIKELHDQITKPKKVIPEFSMEVLGEKADAFINEILLKMKERSFSQFPVFDANGEVCEIISTNTISRWISSNLEADGTIMIDNVRVKDLITEIEHKKNYQFVSRNVSIYDAYEIFLRHIGLGKNLDAIFITNSGRMSEKLLGIITIEDVSYLV